MQNFNFDCLTGEHNHEHNVNSKEELTRTSDGTNGILNILYLGNVEDIEMLEKYFASEIVRDKSEVSTLKLIGQMEICIFNKYVARRKSDLIRDCLFSNYVHQ